MRGKKISTALLLLAVLAALTFIWGNSLDSAVESAAKSGRVRELLRPLLELVGGKPVPRYTDDHNDIVTCFDSGSAAALTGFCAGIQHNSPVDSFADPEPADEPGYTDKVVMASGSFTEGSTIEISCDGPLRTPYTCYLQGGVNFTAGRAAVLNAVQNAFFAD